MFLHTTAFFYIISLFNSKTRRNAVLSFEFSAIIALILSLQIFDLYVDDYGGNSESGEINVTQNEEAKNVTTTFVDSNGKQYTVIDEYQNDNFSDLVSYLSMPRSPPDANDTEKATFELVIIRTPFNESDNPTIAEVLGKEINPNASSFERFQMSVRKQELYRENDPLIDELLHDLATWPIESVAQYKGGTQLKMYVNFTNKGRAMMKPMKAEREDQTNPNHFWFRDLERHNAEIAAFHLDRALGFRRAAPVTGRWINITSEIEAICDEDLKDSVVISPANRKCFHATNCSQYCNIEHLLCGNPEMIEVAMAAFFPFFAKGDEVHIVNPWKRAYSHRKIAKWLNDDEYCDEVQLQPMYEKGRRLLDVMDVTILDYLILNQDRHHYELFRVFGVEDNSTSSPIYLDHGRSFGLPFWEDPVILTPIKHCCMIRESTLATLLKFHNGPIKLSEHMRKSMANDPIAPVLWEPYYAALDRRVGHILQEIRLCMNRTAANVKLQIEQLAEMTPEQREDRPANTSEMNRFSEEYANSSQLVSSSD